MQTKDWFFNSINSIKQTTLDTVDTVARIVEAEPQSQEELEKTDLFKESMALSINKIELSRTTFSNNHTALDTKLKDLKNLVVAKKLSATHSHESPIIDIDIIKRTFKQLWIQLLGINQIFTDHQNFCNNSLFSLEEARETNREISENLIEFEKLNKSLASLDEQVTKNINALETENKTNEALKAAQDEYQEKLASLNIKFEIITQHNLQIDQMLQSLVPKKLDFLKEELNSLTLKQKEYLPETTNINQMIQQTESSVISNLSLEQIQNNIQIIEEALKKSEELIAKQTKAIPEFLLTFKIKKENQQAAIKEQIESLNSKINNIDKKLEDLNKDIRANHDNFNQSLFDLLILNNEAFQNFNNDINNIHQNLREKIRLEEKKSGISKFFERMVNKFLYYFKNVPEETQLEKLITQLKALDDFFEEILNINNAIANQIKLAPNQYEYDVEAKKSSLEQILNESSLNFSFCLSTLEKQLFLTDTQKNSLTKLHNQFIVFLSNSLKELVNNHQQKHNQLTRESLSKESLKQTQSKDLERKKLLLNDIIKLEISIPKPSKRETINSSDNPKPTPLLSPFTFSFSNKTNKTPSTETTPIENAANTVINATRDIAKAASNLTEFTNEILTSVKNTFNFSNNPSKN